MRSRRLRRQVGHLPGADQHDVARLDLQAGQGAGGVEVVGADGVARVEDVEALGPGHIEQHAPADHGGEAVNAAAAAPSSDIDVEAGYPL